MIYCFDLDGTLLNTDGGNYANATPIKGRVEKLKELFHLGETIIISTARNAIWYDFTADQLEQFEIPYHALIVGAKPYADKYVDDKGVNAKDFFN